jgi:predicted nucleic acid-binding protein
VALLIDTSVLIGMERRRMQPEDIERLASPQPGAIASITASELLVGVHRTTPEGRKLRRAAFVERVLDSIPLLPMDLQVARVHARIVADLYAQGQPIGDHDLIIAATALAHGYDVLTDNPRDFGQVPGLVVRRPDW